LKVGRAAPTVRSQRRSFARAAVRDAHFRDAMIGTVVAALC
jgi:hypothetical protein